MIENSITLEKFGRYLMDSFVNIDGTDNLLVLETSPGNAQYMELY